jgi:CelD/BcsL family acetyltransferase involved in cellulose biosynthesis
MAAAMRAVDAKRGVDEMSTAAARPLPPMRRGIEPFVPSGSVPDWWAPLFEASGSDSVFVSPAWMQAWLGLYGNDFQGSWVHWEADGRVVAGCLLVERVVRVRSIPMRSLFLNATGQAAEPTPLAEYNDVLCLPGHADAVAADLARLLKGGAWSRLLLRGHEPGGIAARLVQVLGGSNPEQECKPARFVDLAALGDRPFESTLVGKAGTRVRRNRREFQERLGEITVRRAGDVAEALAFFAEMRELHLARFARRSVATTLASDAVVAFHQRIIRSLFADGGVELVRVGSADRAVGFLYNFCIRRKVLVFQTGFAYEPASSWSPGLLTHALAIEHYRLRGMREYDLLTGDGLYKRVLCNGERPLWWSTLYSDRPWIRLLLAGRRMREQWGQAPRLATAA